jgi:hypothetical protein
LDVRCSGCRLHRSSHSDRRMALCLGGLLRVLAGCLGLSTGVAARCWRTHGHGEGEAARAGERRSEIAGSVEEMGDGKEGKGRVVEIKKGAGAAVREPIYRSIILLPFLNY